MVCSSLPETIVDSAHQWMLGYDFTARLCLPSFPTSQPIPRLTPTSGQAWVLIPLVLDDDAKPRAVLHVFAVLWKKKKENLVAVYDLKDV